MRTLVIPDLHHATQNADHWMATQSIDRVVFLGDFFDAFDDSVDEARRTAIWLRDQLCTWNRVFLWGNHDLHYAFPDAADVRCPGFTQEKADAINDILSDAHWSRFKVAHVEQGWVLSHAGVGVGEVRETERYGLLRSAADAIARGLHHLDSPLLCDWSRREPVPGINQLVGHTPGTAVRSRLTAESKNYCLDVCCGHVAALLEDGQLSLLTVSGENLAL